MPIWGTPKKEDTVTELTPEKLQVQMTETKTALEEQIAALGESVNNNPILARMAAFLDNEKATQDQLDEAARVEAEKVARKPYEQLDPTLKSYIDTQVGTIANATLIQQGTEMRRTIFDNVEAFPLYQGPFKEKVDAYLDKQPAGARANPDVIRNVYKIVWADSQKEIEEGKHKSRLSTSVNPGSGNGMSGNVDKEGLPVLNDAEKGVAAKMGMTEKDYATAKKELEASGEYV